MHCSRQYRLVERKKIFTIFRAELRNFFLLNEKEAHFASFPGEANEPRCVFFIYADFALCNFEAGKKKNINFVSDKKKKKKPWKLRSSRRCSRSWKNRSGERRNWKRKEKLRHFLVLYIEGRRALGRLRSIRREIA